MIGESSLSNKDVGVGIYIDSKSMCWPSLVVSYVAIYIPPCAFSPATQLTQAKGMTLGNTFWQTHLFHTLAFV